MVSSVFRLTRPLARVSGARFAAGMTPAAAALPTAWGSEPWRYSKDAFLQLVQKGTSDPKSPEASELGQFLIQMFHQFDYNLDGKMKPAEFDWLCEDIMLLPRRFGFAKSSLVMYGSEEKRTAARRAIFDAIDATQGEPRGWIAAPEFLVWAKAHIGGNAAKLAVEEKKKVNFHDLSGCTAEEFTEAMSAAVKDRTSKEFANLYEFIMAIFVEESFTGYGDISFEEFQCILRRIFAPARSFGLEPAEGSVEELKVVFDSLTENRKDLAADKIGFQQFLDWVVKHIATKQLQSE